ncbi:Flp pilus assembly complex ATPase component TadA [Candidatus Pacearchaeota archaeon]|nr:Flp pilus assembly complex ATPase component TadA [Candidatus Pacearchaeota archaeon]
MVIVINTNPAIPALPRLEDKKKINVRYALIPPYAFSHIYWDAQLGEVVYEIEEPLLKEHEKDALEKLEKAMLELININVAVENTLEATTAYIDKTARLLIDELNLRISEEAYVRIFYYLFRDFIGLNELDPLLRDYFIEDIECNGVDTPVYVVHRIYRNLRTNLIYHDIDKLASFVEKLAQRTGRYVSYAQPLLDGSLPDGSIDFEEPVIYKENGIVKINKIGKVVDRYYKKEKSNKPVNVKGIEVAAFGIDFKIKWKKADYVYRHKLTEDIYDLKLEFGRKIKLTGNHSIFVLKNIGIVAERTDKLKEGDYVVLPGKIPENDVIAEINLAKELSSSSKSNILILRNIPIEVYEKHKDELNKYYQENYKNLNQTYYEHKNKRIIPIKLYYILSEEELRKCYIGTTSSHQIPTFLKVDKELMRFLGLYIAEGWLYDYQSYGVCFSLHKDELDLINMIRDAAQKCFNLETYVEPPQENGIKVKVDDLILWLIMKEVFKVSKGAKEKRVPELIFNTSKELQSEFIKAWHAGDYSTTMSKDLANEISYLALFNEDMAAFYKGKPKKTFIGNRAIINNGAYYSNFYTRSVERPYPSMIPLEIFNPLNTTHMRLKNKRIDRLRLIRILDEIRYKRFENPDAAPKKFILEWEKRGFIQNGRLNEMGLKLLEEIKLVKNLMESDFSFAKIKKISRVQPTSNYVYDFSVKGNENFIAGFGGVCCHNSRVNATYTKDVTSRGPTFTLRKFTKIPWTPTQLIGMNTISPEMLAYFWLLIQYKSSILISGGTASGKTTLLNALAFFIPPEARVVSLEDTRELNIPRENWLPAVARTSIGIGKVGEVDLFAILKNSFRQNPDYLIVGEVRGKEASVLFQGMASGHASISTMHADSVDTLIRRLQTPPINLSPTLVNSLDCVAIATHALVGKHETRRLREVVEIVNVNRDGTALINTPLIWDPKGDIFYFKKQSKVFEKISARQGISTEKLEKEFVTRTKLLYEMFKQKVFGFEEVQKVVNDYYKNPVEVLNKFNIIE